MDIQIFANMLPPRCFNHLHCEEMACILKIYSSTASWSVASTSDSTPSVAVGLYPHFNQNLHLLKWKDSNSVFQPPKMYRSHESCEATESKNGSSNQNWSGNVVVGLMEVGGIRVRCIFQLWTVSIAIACKVDSCHCMNTVHLRTTDRCYLLVSAVGKLCGYMLNTEFTQVM